MRDSSQLNQVITVSIGIAAAVAFLTGLYLGSKRHSDPKANINITSGEVAISISNDSIFMHYPGYN